MSNTLVAILLLICQVNCIYKYNEIPRLSDEIKNKTIEVGLSQTYSIEFNKATNFIFNITDNETYQINIHSINCNLDADFIGEKINQINLDTYSFKMNKTNNNTKIKPLIDIIDGKEKENYQSKKCHLSINSVGEYQNKVEIKTKDESIFFFESNNNNYLIISYELKEISNETFAALFFQFNEKTNFSINVNCNNCLNSKNIVSKYIYNSTYIFLNSDKLNNPPINNSKIDLSIFVRKNDDKKIKMSFKIIEKEMISMLQKNAINYGFLTTWTKYQYFYLEVSKGEEGELMLHNKRFYGELLAKIVVKDEINGNYINDISNFPKEEENDMISYNPHSLKLMYSYDETIKCLNGCYILITYEQKQSLGDYPNIGYEFTLLSRSWNYSDFNSQIVDIPFNEYVLGAFQNDSITHHYYSIPIPNDAEKIIIQLEGNYIDLFYGNGRKKINTMKIRGNDTNLEIINNENVITLNKTEFDFEEKIISFAVRPKDYFADIFSFYYFRILYVKENEIIYFPMDSQLGNLCLPEYDNQTKLYYCHFMFSNNYNELATGFSVSSFNLNEYYKIFITKYYNECKIHEETKEIFYIYEQNNETNDTDYFLFKVEFQNEEIKNVISTLREKIEYYYPQIYSSQMFYIFSFNKTCLYKMKNKYTIINKYIYGNLAYSGYIDVSFLNYESFFSNMNFRGKPFALDIDEKTRNINYHIKKGEYIFVFKLEYIMRNKGIIEIKSGETRSQVMESGYFPLYYYFKIKNLDYLNIDVNLRLNSYDDSVMQNNFEIKGYLFDEDTIKRKINGEYIQLNRSMAINGTYSNKFKVGLIEVNQNNTNNNSYKYLVIEITNLDTVYINSYLLVEILAKEYSEETYFMPINQYIIETFDSDNNTIRDKNKYMIFINQRGTGQVIIELSPEYNDIELIFMNETNPNGFYFYDFDYYIKNITGFKKYFINKYDNDIIYFNIINPKKRKANYMIRYYYGREIDAYTYYLNDKIDKQYIETNDENITLSLSINPIQIIYNNTNLENESRIYFYISGLLYKKPEKSKNLEELINTTSILQERFPLYENQTIHEYNLTNPKNIELLFRNISRSHSYIYDLQFQVNVFLKKYLFNEEFLIFTKEIDLTDIKLPDETQYLWYILGPVLAVILFLVIFSIVKYIRLNKKKVNLEEEIKSMAYSNDIQKNVLLKEGETSKKDKDYDTTFI